MSKYRIKMKGRAEIECDEDYEIDIDLNTDYGTYSGGFDCSAICPSRTYTLRVGNEAEIEAENKQEAEKKAIDLIAKFEKSIQDGDLSVLYGNNAIVTCTITDVYTDFSIVEINES